MKNLFSKLMVLGVLFTPFLSNAQEEAGFYPPDGSTFNADSSEVTLPAASQGSDYNESISFYATSEITMDLGGDAPVTLGFVSASISNVNTPDGMSYSCDPSDCNFGPDAWGYVTLSGSAASAGSYELDLSAMVTVNLANVGLDADLTFPIPYNGENPILNTVVGTDYSALNSFVPTFILNVSGEVLDVNGCTDSNANNYNANANVDDGSCEYPSMVDGIRFKDEIFTNVNVESNVVYGANIGILTQTPVLEDLTMDIYTPEGDEVTNRPVVILLHTGTFLPPIVNGQATGDKSDNTLVELCTRLAKKGYVAVSANYRLGWNPLSTDPDVRTGTLAQAFYRGYQDAQTAVRYLRMSAAEMGNPYGIGDQFAVGGDGTGGYMSLALAALDKDSEILLPKFIDTSDNAIATYGQPVPYIIQSMWGNLEATNYGWHPTMDLDGDGVAQDVPLCVPNHVGYSSEIDMAFNFGGAMLDTLWMEEGEVPIASMQNTNDEFAPYDVGILTEPVNNDPVIEAHGSLPVIRKATELGNNACFDGMSTSLTDATYGNGDGAANAAAAGHEDMAGLFPLVTPAPSAAPTACGFQEWDGAPWQWWDNNTYGMMADAYQGTPAGTMGCLALLSNPDMSEEKGLAFTDMLDEFFTPRIDAALSMDNSSQDNGPDVQELNLPSGWSMFSTYMLADDMALDAILNPILSNVIIAKDYLGSAFLPEFNFNGVGDLTVGWGYQIKTAEASSLTVAGTYMAPEENPVALSAGWNMIGYLRTEAAAADAVLAELNDAGNLVIAKDYLGSAFLPEFNFNGIGNLEPGRGYQLKTNEAGTLNFLSNDNSYRMSAIEATHNDLKHFELATNTGSNMTISVLADAWKTLPAIGDEIAAYNSKGELIGSAIYTEPVSVISVWGNDATTEKVDGLNNGEAMTFKLWSKRFNTTQELIVKEWIEGANAYQTDAIYQIGTIEAVENSNSASQLGVYPIPAKHELNVDLELGQSEGVTVSIYNLIGELMVTNSYEMSKGINTIKLDIDGLKDGVYLCKVNSGNNQITRKFNVLK